MAPRTDAGRDAVRWPGLFAGETHERRSAWVQRIEEQAVELHKHPIENEFAGAWPKPPRRPRSKPFSPMRDGYEYDSSDQ